MANELTTPDTQPADWTELGSNHVERIEALQAQLAAKTQECNNADKTLAEVRSAWEFAARAAEGFQKELARLREVKKAAQKVLERFDTDVKLMLGNEPGEADNPEVEALRRALGSAPARAEALCPCAAKPDYSAVDCEEFGQQGHLPYDRAKQEVEHSN